MKTRSSSVQTIDALDAEATAAMTFTKGKETYTPIRFHSFEVGPFSVTLEPKSDGETWRELSKRGEALAESVFQDHYAKAIERYFDRVEDAGRRAKQRKESR